MLEVLVVVDMQTHYAAALDPALIALIEQEAVAVVARGGRVVAVCFDGSGESTVKLPPDTPIIWKNRDPGDAEVYAWLVGAGLARQGLNSRFCGVNLCACVLATATGTVQRLRESSALLNAVQVRSCPRGEARRAPRGQSFWPAPRGLDRRCPPRGSRRNAH